MTHIRTALVTKTNTPSHRRPSKHNAWTPRLEQATRSSRGRYGSVHVASEDTVVVADQHSRSFVREHGLLGALNGFAVARI